VRFVDGAPGSRRTGSSAAETIRTTNAIERLREIVLPPGHTAAMLFLALARLRLDSTQCLAKGRPVHDPPIDLVV
jgi:hypothetical protein